MAIIKCKMCGGDLEILEDSSVCECEYCGTKQTVPKVDDEKKLTLFNRAGRLLRSCEFDKAAGVFETIVADFPEEAEAYWGLVLCKYGIEYVDDPATGKKIPTCHRSSFDSVEDDPNYEQACENADSVAHRLYREETRQIETLRKRILEVSGKEEPYDVFISYKELDEDGERTPDSVIAQDIYRALTKEGYRVFFSRISLEGKLGVEYEPFIFAALNSAKVMIVVGTDFDYFNAVWVKNEWSRFLKLIASGQPKTIIPVYKDMDPYDMPKELRALAAQNMGKIGAMQDLLHGVEKLLGKEKAPEKQEPQPVIQQVVSGGPTVEALIQRGAMALEDSDWDAAKGYFDRILDTDVRNANAYLGLYMARKRISTLNALRDTVIAMESDPASESGVYERAKRFATGELAEKLKDWEAERAEAKRKRDELIAEEKRRKEEERLRRQEEERKRQEEERRRKEEERRRKEEEQRRLDNDVEKILLTLRKRRAENALQDLQNALVEERQQLQQKALIAEHYGENLTVRNTGKAMAALLREQITKYEEDLNGLGVFAGKQKEQIKSNIQECRKQLEELETVVGEAEKRLGNYQSRQDLDKEIGIIRESIKKTEEIIEESRNSKSIKPEYSFEEAMRRMNGSEYIKRKVREEYLGVDFLDKKPGDTLTFGEYYIESGVKKPIEWLVLARENGRLLLLSKYALDSQPHNRTGTDETWETCSLRIWLNNEFMKTAFNEYEKKLIHRGMVSADKNPYYKTTVGNSTTDEVFLLSIPEAKKYFTSPEERKCSATAYAKKQGAETGGKRTAEGEMTVCLWWLRTQGRYSNLAAYVNFSGEVDYDGRYVYRNMVAVRPAMWIDLGA